MFKVGDRVRVTNPDNDTIMHDIEYALQREFLSPRKIYTVMQLEDRGKKVRLNADSETGRWWVDYKVLTKEED